jgi:DNA-binding response OmpR family regulator
MQRRGLIVDDDSDVCEFVKKILTSTGVEVMTVTRSSEAPGLFEGKFDLVFLDFHMAAPDGIELARQLRNSRSNRMTPVILISDDQRPSAMSVGFEAGASFFVYKPIDKDRLLKLVRATQWSMEHEQRRTRRVALHSKVLLKLGKEEVEGETVDVSLSGMLVNVPRTFPTGSSVQVSLHLSQRVGSVLGVGSVVRVSGGNQMGIRMERLGIRESEKLQEYLLPLIPGA